MTGLVLHIIDPLTYKFQLFMQNPAFIRYGQYEKVSSKRLLTSFNETQHENISFNRIFPQLMTDYMAKFPQYDLIKKNITKGVFYYGLGLASDPVGVPKPAPLTTKQKNDRRRERHGVVLNELKDQIRQRTGWTEVEYQYLSSLRLLTSIRFDNTFNVEAIIYVTIGELIKYLVEAIAKLKELARCAEMVKIDYRQSKSLDLVVSPPDMAQSFTFRLKAAERTYCTGQELEQGIHHYMNGADKLPKLGYIVYPDIQYLSELAKWLKNRSKYRVQLKMSQVHFIYEITDEPAIKTTVAHDLEIDEIVDIDTRLTRLPGQPRSL